METSTDLLNLYILLSYEKLQRSAISPRQRPIEASLRNRLLVWRFLKKIENDPMTIINCGQEFVNHTSENQNSMADNNPWIVDLNRTCDDKTESYDIDDDIGIDMEIESDLLTVSGNNDLNDFNCQTINSESESDVTVFLKRAIGAERRQKLSSDNFHSNPTNHSNLHLVSETNSYPESEQFFHDFCAELTNTTATLVSSSTTAFNFSASPEQTLIH